MAAVSEQRILHLVPGRFGQLNARCARFDDERTAFCSPGRLVDGGPDDNEPVSKLLPGNQGLFSSRDEYLLTIDYPLLVASSKIARAYG
jgi:hypothetical protein